ncbi:10414_t:CDS:2 [Acaulospora morrowiae]|uniref:10414_t:CDS:1 n=1 Tax=Acaulospora morrowiae TaxID=94023 RepID=A0A9N8V9R8_9GLOM|nr:10414_t:CDS:2 [Acaulospora morrowiae]
MNWEPLFQRHSTLRMWWLNSQRDSWVPVDVVEAYVASPL